MKAVRFHEHGGPEVLRYEEAPDPEVAAHEILVRVRACALNHLDLWLRKGLPGVKVHLPHICGADMAGEVAAVGAVCTRVKPGQRVVLMPAVSCGQCQACLSGRDNLCRHYQILGGYGPVDGGYAEYVKVPEVNAIPLADHLTFEAAAAVPLTFLTAWNMLVALAGLQRGEDVLVIGAGSGVGAAAVQIAKLLGARVIATAGSEAKLAKAKALGADHGINHASQDIAAEVRTLTGKRGVDVVFEHVGEAVWGKCLAALTPGGRLVTCGATTGANATTDLRFVFSKQLSILGGYMGRKADLLALWKFVESGELKGVVDSTFPLREAAAAQRRMEGRQHFGKIVLTP